MRLLFLDFDGVLHPAPLPSGAVHFCWLHILADLLCPHVDVRILVHSTWRYDHTDSELRALLGPIGERFVGAAPRGPRHEAIRWVLSQNSGVTSHCILDDDLREYVVQPLELVACDPSTGVSSPSVQEAVRAWLDYGWSTAALGGKP